MNNKEMSALTTLGQKCAVSSNTLNEMFGLCKHLEPSTKLREDINFNKGIVDMFGATDDIVPSVLGTAKYIILFDTAAHGDPSESNIVDTCHLFVVVNVNPVDSATEMVSDVVSSPGTPL